MKKIKNLFTLAGIAFACLIVFSINVNAQLLVNEIEVDPPDDINSRCQFVELRGTAGSTVAANTYFISINSDQDNFGFLNIAVNVGDQTIGTNGTLVLNRTTNGQCPNRTYDAGATVLNFSSLTQFGQGSEGFYVVTSAAALAAGQDLDTNDDGTLDVSVTFVDGFNFIFNPDEQFKYGPGPILNTMFFGDVPDAATRFPGNNTAFSAAAFYFGELAATPEETVTYAAPFSANFPAGGVLTPGAVNVPAANPNAGDARADFDGDGRTDLSVFRDANGTWFLNRSTEGLIGIQFGQTGDEIVPGDYDNDGRADLAVRRGQIWYILNSGNSSFTGIQFGLASDIAVQGDYDGDGDTDVAVFRPSNGIWYTSTNPATNYGAVAFGQSGDVPVPADYDGDGRTDLAVFRNGTWFLNQSTAGLRQISFGSASDLLVPADYDGDGKDDIAVFRPSEGRWYSIGSLNGTVTNVQFGQMGDIPVPGDYDGDGRDDQAVFRNGTWFLNRSQSGMTATQFGAGSDKAVPNGYIP